jgi:hypothetical protein
LLESTPFQLLKIYPEFAEAINAITVPELYIPSGGFGITLPDPGGFTLMVKV